MSLMSLSTKVRHRAVSRAAGVAVVYSRRTQPIELVAIPARVRDTDFGGDVMELTAREQDWIVWRDDLTLDGVPILPERNDVIVRTDERGNTRKYEVLPRLGERCYRFTDQSEQQLRIFTVEVAAGNA